MGTGLTALGEQQVNFSENGGTGGVAGTQADPAVTALSNGDFVVVYENPHSGDSLLAHFFDASGNPIGPPFSSGLLNGVVGIDPAAEVSVHPAVAATPDGGFLVAYTDTSVTDNSIVVRRYDNTTGISTPFVIDSGDGPITHPVNHGTVGDVAIAAFADGTSLVAWDFDFNSDPTDDNVFFAFLNSSASGFTTINGTPLDQRPLTIANGFEGEPSVATTGNLAAIVYAADPGHKQGDQDIILTVFNSSGTQLVPPTTLFGATNLDVFSHPDVAALSDGRFVIVARDDTTSVLVASIFDPVTRAVTPVNFAATGINPHVAGTPGGGLVVSFDDPSGNVTESRFGPGGSVLFNAGVANSFTAGTQDQSAIAANASGTVFVAWQDAGSGNPNSTDTDTRIEAQAFKVQPLPQPNFNGDLHSDILWQSSNGQASVWEMNGNTLIGGGAVSPNPGPAWKAIGAGDFNDDGHSDILWQNTSSGQATIWDMNGNSLVGGGPVSPNPGPAWQAIGTGDFNKDSHSDILWQNASSGQASIWEMSGNTLIGGGPVSPNPGPTWKAVGTGDFNDDGHSDIIFQNTSSGQVSIWEMNGNTLVGGGPVSPNPGPAWKAIGTGDFNGDGHSDILFQNTSSGQVSVWEMNGNTLIGGGPVSPNPGPSWHAIGTGDFNGDGFSDIVFQNTTGQASIWDMNGAALVGGGAVSPNPGSAWRIV
jgi:FG-GAP-like repeat